jgi:polar amino acid transport system permease protein/polar amino acid transport system substrate-binding protein
MIEEEEQIDIKEDEAPRKKLFTMEKSSRTSILFAILCLIISAACVGYSILLLVDYDYAIQLLRFYTDSGAGKAILGWLMDLNAQIKLNFVDKDRFTTYILSGLGITFTVTFFATLIGIFLGVIVATIRSSHDKLAEELRPGFGTSVLNLLNAVCKVYLTVIRGTPTVVQLMIAYFIIFAASNNKILIAILAFGINSGAYVAEIIRSGIMSVDPGQFEAGRSLGFNYVQTMIHIIIPQAFKAVLPALANEFIVLIKETSVSGYVGLQDLTKGGDIIRSQTYSAFLPLILVAAIYLVIVMFFTKLVSLLEGRLRNSER